VNRLAIGLATWFGCGHWPWGPGTVGSLAAVGIAILLHAYLATGRLTLLALCVIGILPAIWASTRASRLMNDPDPRRVVIDEVLGQWVALLGASVFVWKSVVAGFVLFRVFDIWKPWPVHLLEKLPEGVGIVADDLAAGLYAALILYIGGTLKLY